MGKRHYDVACGILINDQNKILVALRDFNSDQGGLWEFPGGKVEVTEAVEEALCRELAEELGIEVVEAEPWVQVDHEYHLYHVTLYAWKVLDFKGEPDSAEGQPIRWVDVRELATLEFPEANIPIVEELIATHLPASGENQP